MENNPFLAENIGTKELQCSVSFLFTSKYTDKYAIYIYYKSYRERAIWKCYLVRGSELINEEDPFRAEQC